MFIVFEGIDGCGKSTLAKAMQQRLEEMLPQKEIFLAAEPTNHLPTGILLRQHLQQNDRLALKDLHFVEYIALMMAADRQYHFWQEIAPMILRGAWVLCDRFTWSSFAYQSATGMNIEWLVDLNSRVPIPDLTVVVEIDLETARNRMTGTRTTEELFESEQTLRRVASQYRWLVEQKTGIGLIDNAPMLVLNGRLSTEQQVEEICTRLNLPRRS